MGPSKSLIACNKARDVLNRNKHEAFRDEHSVTWFHSRGRLKGMDVGALTIVTH